MVVALEIEVQLVATDRSSATAIDFARVLIDWFDADEWVFLQRWGPTVSYTGRVEAKGLVRR